jgi:hypothetical protein
MKGWDDLQSRKRSMPRYPFFLPPPIIVCFFFFFNGRLPAGASYCFCCSRLMNISGSPLATLLTKARIGGFAARNSRSWPIRVKIWGWDLGVLGVFRVHSFLVRFTRQSRTVEFPASTTEFPRILQELCGGSPKR